MDWTLRRKILLGYGIALALLVLVLALSFTNLRQLGRASEAILSENYRSIQAADHMTGALERQDGGLLLLLLGDREAGVETFRRNGAEFQRWLARAEDNITIEGEDAIVARIDSTYSAYAAAFQRELLNPGPAGPEAAAPLATYRRWIRPAYLAVREATARLRDVNQSTMYAASDRAQRIAHRATGSLAAVGGLVILTGLAFSLVLSRRLVRPLRALSGAARRIAAGDYDVDVPVGGRDELAALGRQFNVMASELRSFRRLNVGRMMAEKRKSEAIVRSIRDGLIVVDHDLRVVNLNPAARAILSVADDADGRHVLEVVKDDALLTPLREALETGRTPEIEEGRRYVTRRRDGAARHYELAVTPVRTDSGETVGGILMLRDVTQLKELDRLRSEFVATASHELRTPLTSIGMSLDLLGERAAAGLGDEERMLLAGAREDVERLRALVEDLLELSRIEAGRIELDFQSADLALMCERACEILRPQAAEQGVAIRMVASDPLPPVRADVGKVTWILTNLLSNAVRYSESGDEIVVAAAAFDSDVEISVRDEGAGIPYEYQARVFDKFVQVGDRANGGTGLGLAICREVVRAHGGSIWVESTPGEGSTFTFTLPRA